MSHPFSLEYMLEGEISSTQKDEAVAQVEENQEKSVTHKCQINSRPSRSICESESVIDGCPPTGSAEEPRDALEQIKEEQNVDITDEEAISSFKAMRIALRCRMTVFAEEANIVGLSYLVKPSSHKIGSILRKVIWTLLLLFGTGFMVFQIYDRISSYLTYPTVVNYRVAYNRSLRFPTVTICPELIASKKNAFSIGTASLRLKDPEITLRVQSIHTQRLPPLRDFEITSDSSEFCRIFRDLDWEFFYASSTTQLEQTLLECSFMKKPCNSSDAITKIKTDVGMCFSFNPASTNYVTTHPGANYGLRLVLWVNQSDCFITWSSGAGFRVSLHDPHDMVMMQTLAIRVGTGISASISISLRNVTMLPRPYGVCRQDENYTYAECMLECFTMHSISTCGCRPLQFEVPGTKLCSPGQYYFCVSKLLKWFHSSGESSKCDCPIQCKQTTYPYSISTSPLSQHFLNYISKSSQFKGRNLTISKLSKELVYLDIFYSQLSYVDIKMIPAYDLLTLVCDIGGAVGLILGGTILTVFEFLQCLVQLFKELVISARFAKMQRR